MSEQQPIVQSLLDLSEAIEQLALTIARQKNSDLLIQQKQLSVITEKFINATQIIQPEVQQKRSQLFKQKYKKGFIREYLGMRNIYVENAIESLRADENLYKAVDFLQDHFNLLKDFYSHLKRSQSLNTDFNYKTTTKSIQYIQKWCEMLYHHKLIDGFNIISNSEIFVDTAQIAEASSFISGYWLEILLRREVALFIDNSIEQIHSFDILSQADIVKPNHTNTELDLVLMLNDQIYWFECKSGQINAYYERFKVNKRDLGMADNRSFLVIPSVDRTIPKFAKQHSSMQTLFGTELDIQLKNHLKL